MQSDTDSTPATSRESPADDAAEHDALVDSAEMPFMAHVVELRQRILRGLLAVFVLFLPIYFFANDLYELVAAPLMAHLPDGGNMIATEVATPFLTPFKLAVYAAIFVGMPVLLHQAWSFVAPGLYKHEKRFALPLLFSSISLFYLGMAFAYFLVFPLVFAFMASVTPVGVTMMTDINRYLDFVLTMFFAFGFAFEIPIATLLLVWSGVSTASSIARKTTLRDRGVFHWRHAAHAAGRDLPVAAGAAHLALVRSRHPVRARRREAQRKRLTLTRSVSFQKKRHRPVIDQGDLHDGAEAAGLHVGTAAFQAIDVGFVEPFGLFRRCGAAESGAPAPADVPRQRELGNHQNGAADIEHGAIHGLVFVGEDAQCQRLLDQPVDLLRPVVGKDADEGEEAVADSGDHRGLHGDRSTRYALQQNSHGSGFAVPVGAPDSLPELRSGTTLRGPRRGSDAPGFAEDGWRVCK